METRRGKGASGVRGASPAQIREAERGFEAMLRRRFSAAWIADNAGDLMAQANVEYAEWLEENPPARNPVGWLLTCANRRALNLLDAQTRRPRAASLDAVLHLPDEATPDPEEQILEGDRRERLKAALGRLPEKECRLLALVYYGDLSIREAGRRLGWQKSAADKHHRAALERLEALVGDRSLLSPAHLGWGAWAAAYGDRHRLGRAIDGLLTPARGAVARVAEFGHRTGRRLAEAAGRVGPAGEHAGAAASAGAGRLAGACGVAAASVVCGIAAGGLLPAAGVAVHTTTPARRPAPLRAASRSAPSVDLIAPPPEPRAEGPEPEPEPPKRTAASPAPKARAPKAPVATTEQTIQEFGVEGASVAQAGAGATAEGSGSAAASAGGSRAAGSSGGSRPTPPGVEFGP